MARIAVDLQVRNGLEPATARRRVVAADVVGPAEALTRCRAGVGQLVGRPAGQLDAGMAVLDAAGHKESEARSPDVKCPVDSEA
jgi:hypothetical protein